MLEAAPHGTAVFHARHALDHFFLRTLQRSDVFIASNLLVIDRDGEAETRLGPDLLVAFGLEQEPESSYEIAAQGKPPDWVLEVASPSSGTRDRTLKKRQYAAMGIREYWILDPGGSQSKPQLQGFRLERGRYVRLPPDAGTPVTIQSEVLGLDLWLDGATLRLRHPDARKSAFAGQDGEAMQFESAQELTTDAQIKQEFEVRRDEVEAAQQSEAKARREAAAHQRVAAAALEANAEAKRQAEAARQAEARARRETEAYRREAFAAQQAEAKARREAVAARQAEAKAQREALAARQDEATALREAETRVAELEARLQELENSYRRRRSPGKG